MVEILEEGKLNCYKVKCNKCKSVLKFTDLDEEENYDKTVKFFVKCPKCNQKNLTRAYSEVGGGLFIESWQSNHMIVKGWILKNYNKIPVLSKVR